jgi:ubiquinol-cytochrome c reductase cytochrome c subunit
MGRLVVLPVLAGLAAFAAVLLAPGAGADEDDPLGYVVDVEDLDDPEVIARGEELYRTGCVSCHGPDGAGLEGPDIRDAGAAGAHFYLTSGRMPMADDSGQATRKEPAYDPDEIEALVAYVATLGDGPPIPDIDPASADLQAGGEIFRQNCAACHQAAGAGGALSYGRHAPSLVPPTPVQVAAAIRIGPGEMPVFGPDQLSDEEVEQIVRYVEFLQEGDDPGGFSLGRIGPVPEGLVAIVVGLGAATLGAFWVGRRKAAA